MGAIKLFIHDGNTRTVYSGPEAIRAICRAKTLRHISRVKKCPQYPQGTWVNWPLHTMSPQADAAFLRTSEGKMIKKVVEWMYYNSVTKETTRKEIFAALNKQLMKRCAAEEAFVTAINSAASEKRTQQQVRSTAIFLKLHSIVAPQLKEYLKTNENIEGAAIEGAALSIAFDQTAEEQKKGLQLVDCKKQKLESVFDAETPRDAIITLTSNEWNKSRTLFVSPAAKSLYDSEVGELQYVTLKGLQEDVDRYVATYNVEKIRVQFIETAPK